MTSTAEKLHENIDTSLTFIINHLPVTSAHESGLSLFSTPNPAPHKSLWLPHSPTLSTTLPPKSFTGNLGTPHAQLLIGKLVQRNEPPTVHVQEIFEKLPDQLQGFELLAIVTNYLDWNVLGKRFDGIFFWNWSDFISVVRSLNTPICSWKAASLVSCTRTKQFSRMQIILPCLNDHWFSKSTGWLLNLWMWIQNALHIAYHIILLCRFVLPNMSNSNSHLESFKYI